MNKKRQGEVAILVLKYQIGHRSIPNGNLAVKDMLEAATAVGCTQKEAQEFAHFITGAQCSNALTKTLPQNNGLDLQR